METMKYSTLINADRVKIWDVMLNDKTYREWTKPFDEDFHYGRKNRRHKIQFLAPGANGKIEGMYSRVKENIPYQYISIEHLDMIKDGKVDTFENYTFTEKGDQTELKVEMQTAEEDREMFDEMWPKALKALKELSEK